jgi:hypothetical protein
MPVFETERGSRVLLSLPATEFPELNEAKGIYEKLVQEKRITEQRLRTLDDERDKAIKTEKRALAKAIKQGKEGSLKDQGKAEERIEKERAACARRLEAIEEALDEAESDLIALVDEHGAAWLEKVERSLDEVLSVYADAVEALASIRGDVSSKYALIRWLRGFPETELSFNDAPGIALLPRLRAAHGEPYHFAEVLETLREDAQTRPKPVPHAAQETQRIHEERLVNERGGRGYFTNDELNRKKADPLGFEHGAGVRIYKSMPGIEVESDSTEQKNVLDGALFIAPGADDE